MCIKNCSRMIIPFLVLISFLTACTYESNVSKSLEEKYHVYFYDAAISGIVAESWDVAEEINPIFLIEFFCVRTQLSRLSTDADPFFVPAYIVEDFICLYFDVEEEHLRQARYYNKDKRGYDLPIMPTFPQSFKVTNAAEGNNSLILSFEFYSPADDKTVTLKGELQIDITDIHNYKYISCKVKES